MLFTFSSIFARSNWAKTLSQPPKSLPGALCSWGGARSFQLPSFGNLRSSGNARDLTFSLLPTGQPHVVLDRLVEVAGESADMSLCVSVQVQHRNLRRSLGNGIFPGQRRCIRKDAACTYLNVDPADGAGDLAIFRHELEDHERLVFEFTFPGSGEPS